MFCLDVFCLALKEKTDVRWNPVIALPHEKSNHQSGLYKCSSSHYKPFVHDEFLLQQYITVLLTILRLQNIGLSYTWFCIYNLVMVWIQDGHKYPTVSAFFSRQCTVKEYNPCLSILDFGTTDSLKKMGSLQHPQKVISVSKNR